MSEKAAEIHERKLWFDGPNLTADAIVIDPKHGQILLIQRRDTGQWALPGGFIDPDDTDSAQAAIREVAEETGLRIEDGDAPLVFQGRVDDPRNSSKAWIETSAHLFLAESDNADVRAGDDAACTKWHDLSSLPELYASHLAIIDNAVAYLLGRSADLDAR